MAAVTQQQSFALTQRRCQIESLDAPARPAPDRAIAAKDNRGPIKFLQNSRGHDTNDANVPVRSPFDDDEVLCGIKPRPHHPHHVVANSLLNFPPALVALVKFGGQRIGFGEIFSQ